MRSAAAKCNNKNCLRSLDIVIHDLLLGFALNLQNFKKRGAATTNDWHAISTAEA
jgi:hypothetical protein